MATARQVYDVVCWHLWEDNGLTLGIVTVQQFLDLLNLAIVDFLREGCPVWLIDTQQLFAGQPQYTVPDEMMRVDEAFLGGVYMEMTHASSLPTGSRGWRIEPGIPVAWHADELPIKLVEISPPPAFNGETISGPNEPGPPHAQQGSFDITDLSSGVIPPDQHGGLTLVGPRMATPVTDLGDEIPLLDDDFALAYLWAGVLRRLYSSDNELKDLARAEWCQAQFSEGISVLKQIGSEAMVEN